MRSVPAWGLGARWRPPTARPGLTSRVVLRRYLSRSLPPQELWIAADASGAAIGLMVLHGEFLDQLYADPRHTPGQASGSTSPHRRQIPPARRPAAVDLPIQRGRDEILREARLHPRRVDRRLPQRGASPECQVHGEAGRPGARRTRGPPSNRPHPGKRNVPGPPVEPSHTGLVRQGSRENTSAPPEGRVRKPTGGPRQGTAGQHVKGSSRRLQVRGWERRGGGFDRPAYRCEDRRDHDRRVHRRGRGHRDERRPRCGSRPTPSGR